MSLVAVARVTSSSMRRRSVLAAPLLVAAITALLNPSRAAAGDPRRPASVALSEAPASVDQPEAPATPYTAPGGY